MAEQGRIKIYRRRVALAIALASYAIMSLESRLNMHNNILPGWMKVDEYLNGNTHRMFNRVKMTPQVFTVLCTCLKELNLIEDTRGLSVEQQPFIFLSIVAQSQSSYAVQVDFQHLGKKITCHFIAILKAISALWHELICSPDYKETSQFLLENAHKYLSWFKILIFYFL